MIFLTAKKLHDDLDLWISIGIGDDIVTFKDHRPEYQRYVNKYKHLESEEIPKAVLLDLEDESKKPLLMQKTFWLTLPFNFKFLLYQLRTAAIGSINKATKFIR